MAGFYVTVAVVAMTYVAAVRGDYNEPDWGFQSYLNEPYSFKCNHSTLIVSTYNYVEWELPDGTLLKQGTEKYWLSNGDPLVSNLYLTVQMVQDSDAGVYVCHVYQKGDKKVKRGQLLKGLNLGGPKYREPFDEYRENLMVGGLAALVLFVPLVSACLIYKFRYQTKEQRAAKHAARQENNRHQRYLETHGKGPAAAELSEISVNGGKGESNPVYDNSDEVGTRL